MSLTVLPEHFPRPTAPLMVAAVAGDSGRVSDIVKSGASINEYTEEGFSALIYASVMGHVQVVETLLAQGAEVNPPPGKVRMSHFSIFIAHIVLNRFGYPMKTFVDKVVWHTDSEGASVNSTRQFEAPVIMDILGW